MASRAIGLNAEDTADLNFNINRNTTITGIGGPVLEIFGVNDSVISGHVDNNGNIENNGTTNRPAARSISTSRTTPPRRRDQRQHHQ